MEIPLNYFLILSAILFCIGISIVVIKRHIIVILMGIELMLNAVNINLVAFGRHDQGLQGQSMTLFVLVVAAAEAVVALAIILMAYKYFHSVNMDDFSELKG